MWLGVVIGGWTLVAAMISLIVALARLREAERRLADRDAVQREMLDRLRANEYRVRAIIESVPECVKLQGADGTVLEINPAGLKLVDADSPRDIVGKPIYTIVAPEDQARYRQYMRRVFDGERVVYEFHSITLANRSCFMETHAVPLRDAHGAIYALLGITRDITAQRFAEERARQQQAELARVARLSTMGEMATGLAHELNQPLSAIANFTRGCIRRMRAGEVEAGELIETLEEVCEQAERAGEVMRHIRDFVRKSEPHMAEVDVNELVRSVIRFTDPEIRQQGVVVHLDLAPELPRASADGIMIEQVICNLVRNAAEAMVEAGSIHRTITITTGAGPDGGVRVEIADTGPGILADNIDHVFDQFFTTKADGVGMGLAISRSIVESHGGALDVASPAAGGAVFGFHLPKWTAKVRVTA